jgi:hypothetical protein
MGVNQGGAASGLLFRKYMIDLSDYLHEEFGIVIGDTIVAHLLWADDLVLMSDTPHGLQQQVDGLMTFCKANHMIINEIKTKFMGFGKTDSCKINLLGNPIERVKQYKYLGCIVKEVRKVNSDVFANNYNYLCEQARKAVYASNNRVKHLGSLPPYIKMYIFDSLS